MWVKIITLYFNRFYSCLDQDMKIWLIIINLTENQKRKKKRLEEMRIPMHKKTNGKTSSLTNSLWVNLITFFKVMEIEQVVLLDTDFQRNMFEEEKNDLKHFINNETDNIVWLGVSGTLMATKRSTLVL